jgi:protoporphyrinogen IX oxidase
MLYDWIKAGHVIFVIFWMAGLFMLPRFFVYHQEAAPGSTESAQWIERERRLVKIILNPAMVIVWVLGLILASKGGWLSSTWFSFKLLAVVGLSAYHGYMVSYARKLANGAPTMSGKQLRLLNEVPGIAATLIVILVIIKPF